MQTRVTPGMVSCDIPAPRPADSRRVADLMQPDVRSVAPESRLSEVVLELADAHVTALAVVDAGGRLVGVISTADLLQAQAEAAAGDWANILVTEIMTRPALTIAPDALVTEATQLMLYRDVHRLFVVDRDRLVGVISQTDIVRALGSRRIAI